MITSKYVRGATNHTKFVGKNNSSRKLLERSPDRKESFD